MRKQQGKRIASLDAIRGLAIVNMVAYHAVYDWVYVFGKTADWFGTHAAYLWEQAICWTFILLAGMVSVYSRNLARHGAQVLACAMILTVVTALVLPEQIILFGVLHLLGTAMLLTAMLRPWLQKLPAGISAAVCFGLFLLFKGVPRGFAGLADIKIWLLPQSLYQAKWAFFLGFPAKGFWSSDYFPLIPWIFLFWTGMFLWQKLRGKGELILRRLPEIPALSAIGRHSLLIYMLHQPLTFAALWLITCWM